MTLPWWRRVNPARTASCDVLVVGAGICGVSAALHLERRGLKALVIERGQVACGASSRNAGFLMRGGAENYAEGIALYGRDRTRALWQLTERNIAALRAEGAGQLPGFQDLPSCLLALGAEEEAALEQSQSLMREDGFAVEMVRVGDDAAWRNARPRAGLLNPHDATCNSYELVRLLASKLSAPVLEAQEAAPEFEQDGLHVKVRTGDMLIRASKVLVCTNAYAPLLLPALAGVVSPTRGQMLAVRGEPGARLDCAYYANHGYEYFRQGVDGTLLFGGCRKSHATAEVGYEDRITPPVQSDIERFAAFVLGVEPDRLNVVARWSGTMGFTRDWLPAIGPVEGGWGLGNVWFCGGFSGHGMSMGFETARLAVAAMLDGAPTQFGLDRLLGGIPASGLPPVA